MPLSPKSWQDSPSTATPINAAALVDLETRLGAYADTAATSKAFINRGAWVTSNSYAARDVATWQGSTFVALNAVSSGGSNPRVDTTNWLVWAQGGGEIAYAENVAGSQLGPTGGSTLWPIPGCSIVIPAGTGIYNVDAFAVGAITYGASATAADTTTFRIVITDEANNWLGQGIYKQYINAANQGPFFTMHASRHHLPAPGSAKTLTANLYIDSFTNVANTILFTSAANGVGAAYTPPAFIQAVAA